MTEKFMRINTVIETTGKSRSAIYADIAKGLFPKPILIGARSVGWQSSLIAEWVQSRIEKAKLKSIIDKWGAPTNGNGYELRAWEI